MAKAGSLTILKRELSGYFNSPIAYLFAIVFTLLTGSLFMSQFFLVSVADMRAFFQFMPVILCVFLPAVTMRLWAEEKKDNTYELLLTFPMKPGSLVGGKFLASVLFFAFSLALTLPIPAMVAVLGRPDPGPILGGYLGTLFAGTFFLALGIFISGLFRDQIVAFIVTLLCCFLLFLTGTEFIASSLDGWLPGMGSFLRKFFGFTLHFAGFQKGVIDVRDVLYFAAGTAVFLVLNGFWIEGRMRPNQNKIFASAAAILIAIFVSSNWLFAGFNLGRFDLTEGHLYTVSPVSKKILAGLKAPVTVKYYVSPQEKMPTGLKTLEQDVIDKLDELKIASGGKLQYKVFHMEAANIVRADKPGKEESLEVSLERKGIQPFQVQSIEADELGVRLVYSAAAVAYLEKAEEILPRIIPANLDELEYLLMSKIYRMTLPKNPEVAVFAPYQQAQTDPAMAALLAQLGQSMPENRVNDDYRLIPLILKHEGYKTKRIRLTQEDPIPPGTDTLVILEPENLSEEQREEIASFLSGGGNVFMAVQTRLFEYNPSRQEGLSIVPVPKNPDVNPLLARWGIGVSDDFLLDSRQEVLNIAGGMRIGPFAFSVPVKLPFHMRIDSKEMNPDVSITARLEPILYLWGSALTIDRQKIESLGLNLTTLLLSGPKSWTIPAQNEPFSPDILSSAAPKEKGPFPVAVLLEGNFPGEPGQPGTSDPQTEEPPQRPGKLILIGGVLPFQETFFREGGHLNFFLNSVDALSLGEDLIRIRAKKPVDRAIRSVSTPEKLAWRFFTVLLIPILTALGGAFRILSRARTKKIYLERLRSAS